MNQLTKPNQNLDLNEGVTKAQLLSMFGLEQWVSGKGEEGLSLLKAAPMPNRYPVAISGDVEFDFSRGQVVEPADITLPPCRESNLFIGLGFPVLRASPDGKYNYQTNDEFSMRFEQASNGRYKLNHFYLNEHDLLSPHDITKGDPVTVAAAFRHVIDTMQAIKNGKPYDGFQESYLYILENQNAPQTPGRKTAPARLPESAL